VGEVRTSSLRTCGDMLHSNRYMHSFNHEGAEGFASSYSFRMPKSLFYGLSNHHQWGGIVSLGCVCFVLSVSLVASCMAACMFVWWRKRVCSTVMFTMYVMHATRAFFLLLHWWNWTTGCHTLTVVSLQIGTA